MATTKTLLSNISSLVHNGLMTQAEANKYRNRLNRQVKLEATQVKTAQLAVKVKEFMKPGTAYSISDLVLNVMSIKAPCHGYVETKEEQKYRDGVVKPLMIAALQHIGSATVGKGAQTKYLIPALLPSIVTLDQVDEA
jgi:hypothetical protein